METSNKILLSASTKLLQIRTLSTCTVLALREFENIVLVGPLPIPQSRSASHLLKIESRSQQDMLVFVRGKSRFS